MPAVFSSSPSDNMRLRVIGGLAVAVGLTVVTGWTLDVPALTTFVPDGSPMVMNAALAMLLCGGALLALAQGWRWAAGLGGAVVAAGCAGLLLQVILNRSLGLDELFWKHPRFAALAEPGRLTPDAAMALLFVGWALVLEARGRKNSWLQPVLGGMVITFTVLPGLNYGLGRLFFSEAHGIYRGLALPTAGGLLLLATALARPTRFAVRGEGAALSFMAAALGMLISIGVMVVQSSAELAEANRAVTLTYEVRGNIDHFISEIARMESSARAYALTGTESFADRYDFHRLEVSKQLDELRSLVADNPGQSGRVAALHTLAMEKFTQSKTLLLSRQEGGVEAAARFLAGQPPSVTSALVNLAGEMQAEETRVLAERIRDGMMVEHSTRMVRLLGGALALLLMSLAFNSSRRSAKAHGQAEAKRRESEERFRNAFEFAGIGMAIVGLDGRWLRVNQSICDIVGYPAEELLKKTFQEMTHPDDLQADLSHAQLLLDGKQRFYQLEKRYFRRDGQVVWIRLTGSLVRDAAGAPVHFVAQIEDITVRKQLAQALAESEERTRLFAEHAPASVAMFDRNMHYLVVSKKWISDYKLEGKPVIGRSHYEVFPDIPERWKQAHRDCLGGAVSISEADLFERSDGTMQWLRYEVRPWLKPDGKVGGIVMFTQDITQQKELQQSLALARDQALEGSRLKSEFLASVSHEIRTPMNGIIGMTGLLLDTPLSASQQEMGRVIQSSADNLLTIINDILDFSKIEAGKLDIAAVEFELQPLVDEALALLAPQAQQKNLKLHCDFDPRLGSVLRGDAGRIRQVLLNLFGNAIKFTERGEIVIAVRWLSEQGGRVRFLFEVTDTGIGIPAAVQKELFQPFTQGDGSTTRRYGGTGLGLAISRQLVELMGGEIGLNSSEGRGSCFWFRLELPTVAGKSRPDRLPAAESPPAATPGQNQFHLLVAEDNTTNQLVVQGLVERMGGTTDFAQNGAEALQLLARKRYDAVLLDCQMPVMDGYAAARQIRAGAVPGLDPRIPIIALTAYAMPKDRRKCLEAGMDDYVAKPVRAELLREAIARCGLVVATGARVTGAAGVADDALHAAQIEMLRELPGLKHPALLQDVIEIFLEETPATLATLRRLVGRREQTATAKLAHRLAGSCGNLGGEPMRRAAHAVELAADLDNWAAMPEKLAALEEEWSRLRDALQTLSTPPFP